MSLTHQVMAQRSPNQKNQFLNKNFYSVVNSRNPFLLNTFSFHKCSVCSFYDGSTGSEAVDLHRKGKGVSNLENNICSNEKDEGALQSTIWDRGETK